MIERGVQVDLSSENLIQLIISFRLIEYQIKRMVKTFKASSPEIQKKEKAMKLSSLNPSALAGAIENRLRHARLASRRARLHRELARLPGYVARDLGIAPDQDGYVNFPD
jgi:hypothetical protein